ncbi:hypothetical protein [Bernardetia sp.]|uniref:hypothetical protein n=1 Tax=Bernardetia sp. TaxID=1937974 RepID=UPI0025B80191|nr:hypothetical protein [Bernardetia sp.]
MSKREPILMVATGTKGVGKTFTTLKEMQKYVTLHKKKVVVFDTNYPYETSYKPFKSIAIKNLSRLKKPQIRRILPLNSDGSPMTSAQKEEALDKILNNFSDGLLVLEDINSYLIAPQKIDVINALTTNRHRKMDLMLHYQSLSVIYPRIWQNMAAVRFHYQLDDITRYKSKIPNYELMKLAQLLVNYEYELENNKRFFIYVDFYNNAILGATKKQISRAAQELFRRYKTLRNGLSEREFITSMLSKYGV